jgi:predicted RNA-binding Zn-ribbon protein involved in translation (DUF1610 family)
MNLIKDIQNLQHLSTDDHPLEEVISLASESNSETCPECGGNLIREMYPNYQEVYICRGCGNTFSN